MSYYATQPSFPQLYAAAQAAQAAYPGARAESRDATAGAAGAAAAVAAAQAAQAAQAATAGSTAQQQAYAAYAAQAAAAAAAAQSQQAQQAPAVVQPREDVVGSVAHISVTGCTHSTVGGIVRGNFTANGQNHGRPTYKKDTQVNGLDVQLYFWDDRDGASFCGWWFGPKVGGDQVWAYHPSNTATTPPKTGWKVPYDGPVDNSFLISASAAPAAVPALPAPAASEQYGSYQYSQYSQEQSIKQKQQEIMAQQMIAQQQKAVALGEMKRKQEEQRRQQEENRLRQQEEMKRRAAEQRQKMEEQTRKNMEEQKRLAEERKRQFEEQKAAMTLRHFLAQKIRVAKEESELQVAQQELAELMQQELPKCGTSAEKVQTECAQAVEITLKRIETVKEQKRKEEERKEELAKKNREAQEKAAELLKEMSEKVIRAEELLEQLSASTEQLNPEKEMKLEIVTKAANSMGGKADEASEALKLCQDFMREHASNMRAGAVKPPGATEDDKPTLHQLIQRMSEVQKKKDTLIRDGSTNKEKLLKKAEAKKKMDVQLQKFKRYDADKDEMLNKKEIGQFAKKEYSITLTDQQLTRILKGFDTGVKKADFHRLIVQIGIAREMQKDAARKKKREAHEKEIEALKEELLEKVKEADGKYLVVEEKVKALEDDAKPLLNSKSLTSTEMQPLLEKLEEQATTLKEEISSFKSEIAEMKEGVDSEVAPWFTQQCRPTDGKTLMLDPRLTRVTAQVTRSKGELKLKISMELQSLEKQMLAMLRYHQKAKELSAEDLYSAVAGKKDVVEKKAFLNFFKKCEKEKKEDEEVKAPSAEDLTRLFEHLQCSSAGISKERMMGLIRVFKKVIKETILTEEKGIKSTTKRRLEVAEIIEVLSQESQDEEVDVMRVQCRAIKDDAEGWATVSGDGGSKFLVDYAGVYKVVKETIMTETFEIDSAEAKEAAKQLKDREPRKLRVGELVDVWVWPKKESSGLVRLKCKSRLDGQIGWVTQIGNAGTVFLEVV